jgi:hypothetical protein
MGDIPVLKPRVVDNLTPLKETISSFLEAKRKLSQISYGTS